MQIAVGCRDAPRQDRPTDHGRRRDDDAYFRDTAVVNTALAALLTPRPYREESAAYHETR
jgi:hypothetical protein